MNPCNDAGLLVFLCRETSLLGSVLRHLVVLGRNNHHLLLLSLGKQHERRGMKAQKVILRGPFARPPTPFAHSSAPSRCSCGSHRSARPLLGSENTLRSSGAVSPCGCLALPGCCQRAR